MNSMSTLFYRRPRITVLVICLILVAGLSSFALLPRMEDPLLTERVAMINTRFPGADAERVEALVTEKLEEELREVDEIKELRSVSRAGISSITVELRDDIYKVDSIWSRLRDKVDDVTPLLPDGALEPEFDEVDVKAYALIVALTWDSDAFAAAPPNYAILRRLSERLEDELRAVPGTEEVGTFGDPGEEIVVEVDLPRLAGLGLTVSDVAAQLAASDAKLPAGQLRGRADLLLEVQGELDSLDRIRQIPIRYSESGQFVPLSEVAVVRKSIADPPGSLAVVDGQPAIALGVMVRSAVRVDLWSEAAAETVAAFGDMLPAGVELRTVFHQNEYVATRLSGLLWNLLCGGAAVAVVILVLMGWRSALIVCSALPLSALMVLTGMRFLEIPIHQMSVTGLIVALGLLIDNAIVIVDEVSAKLRSGRGAQDAVRESVGHLAVPLLGSTLTTAFAFAPIALMPGPAGEFVGSIAVSVILAIFSSLFLALTIVPTLTALGVRVSGSTHGRPVWHRDGWSSVWLRETYRRSLDVVFKRPLIGLVVGLVLPVLGFLQARHLPEQFFPPADRDQVQIEVDLPAQSSLAQTRQTVLRMRDELLSHEEVESVSWFIGESAPSFYYNLVPRRQNTSKYAQALVQLRSSENSGELVRRLQQTLDGEFTQARVLVRQLEQGPPFDAPVEVRLYGPDREVLRNLGDQVRAELSEIPNVVHTRSDFAEATATVSLQVPEEEARLAGLDLSAIAMQLNQTLEGQIGGSVLEETEELPVRVRVAGQERADLAAIASTELVTAASRRSDYAGIPLSALADVSLIPETSAITRMDGRRMNEVQAYLAAGVLPAVVQHELVDRLQASGFELPPGYSLEYGGEAAKRDDAVGNLMANVGVLMVLMVATLVLSFSSFRMAGIIGSVAGLSAGLGVGALWVFGHPFGFMAIVGTMGLIGVAINDAIVVLAVIRENPSARSGDPVAVRDVVVRATRHVVATTLTTIAGFLPLLLGGGGFWPPLATAIAGGVGGATILALYFAPSAYVLAMCRGCRQASAEPSDSSVEPEESGTQPASQTESEHAADLVSVGHP